MRNISPHISLVDHVRDEALCLVHGNLVSRDTQRAVKHRHRDACTFVTRYPPAYRALSIANGKVKGESGLHASEQSPDAEFTCFFNRNPEIQFDKTTLPMIECCIICSDIACADCCYEWREEFIQDRKPIQEHIGREVTSQDTQRNQTRQDSSANMICEDILRENIIFGRTPDFCVPGCDNCKMRA
jgi:hypothetical protein